jgi:hypothetical protein
MRQSFIILFFFTLCAAAPCARAQEDAAAPPSPAPPPPTATIPAHDHHEGLTVTAEPGMDPAKSEQLFGKQNPYKGGILAVEISLRNETPQPMRLTMNTIRLEIGSAGENRDKVAWLSPRQVARLIIYPAGAPNVSTKRRLPPVTGPANDKKVDKLTDVIRPFALDVDIIPPLGTIHGYLFFDVDHDFTLVPDAVLYVPDIKIVEGNKPLMFFEIPFSESFPRKAN